MVAVDRLAEHFTIFRERSKPAKGINFWISNLFGGNCLGPASDKGQTLRLHLEVVVYRCS